MLDDKTALLATELSSRFICGMVSVMFITYCINFGSSIFLCTLSIRIIASWLPLPLRSRDRFNLFMAFV